MTDNQILLEVLKEVRQLREEVSDVLILFKPVPEKKRLTKKQKFEIEVQKYMAEETARILSS